MSVITVSDNITCCLQTRAWVSGVIEHLLIDAGSPSEYEFASKIADAFVANPNVYQEGWYAPPPLGVSALFSSGDNYTRLQYDNLRREEFWPRDDFKFDKESVALLYASPINRRFPIVGDVGMTVYRGNNPEIKSHLNKCLMVLEQAAEYVSIGMEFRDLYDFAQALFRKNKLTNARTLTLTDTSGTNLGHTVPWSYEGPNEKEEAIVNKGDLKKVRDLISRKRVHLNGIERFKVPSDIAFTLEARLEDSVNPKLPNVFYHLIIALRNGEKIVSANFNNVFKVLGMEHYIKSKY